MAGLMDRASTVVKAKFSKLLDRAENPEETLDYSYERQLEAQQQKLVTSEQQLQAKVEAFRTEKETIKAQYSAAEAQVKINESATGIGEQMADTGLAIQRAKDKTEQMQARAAAMDELVASGTLDDLTAGDQTQLDRELAQLSSQSQVDDELAKMKAELGSGEQQKELQQ